MLALLAPLAAGCGEAGPPAPNLGPPLIELLYQGTSAERPLEQVYLHSTLDNYGSATNLLQTPLVPGEKVEPEGFTPGSYYLTVVRKQLSLPVSDLIALTTASPLALQSGRFAVWVFDESFRIYDPVPNN